MEKRGTEVNSIHLKIYTLPNCIFCKAMMSDIKDIPNVQYTEIGNGTDMIYNEVEDKYKTNYYPIIEVIKPKQEVILRKTNLGNRKSIIILDDITEIINHLKQL